MGVCFCGETNKICRVLCSYVGVRINSGDTGAGFGHTVTGRTLPFFTQPQSSSAQLSNNAIRLSLRIGLFLFVVFRDGGYLSGVGLLFGSRGLFGGCKRLRIIGVDGRYLGVRLKRCAVMACIPSASKGGRAQAETDEYLVVPGHQ